LGRLDVGVDRLRDRRVGPSCLVLIDDRGALAVVAYPGHQGRSGSRRWLPRNWFLVCLAARNRQPLFRVGRHSESPQLAGPVPLGQPPGQVTQRLITTGSRPIAQLIMVAGEPGD
jgi:hypothetical protein